LLAGVEDNLDREWLEQVLVHSHEPSLSQRLHQTLARCPRVASRAVGSRKKRDSFIWRVVKTRNYKTHLDPLQKEGAADGVALVSLVFQLKAIVEMTLLLELGFSCEQVDEIFERTRRYEAIENIKSQIS
jgi:Apea-like HEPN